MNAKRMTLAIGIVMAAVAFAMPAWAAPQPTPPPGAPRADPITEMTMSGVGPFKSVTGFIANDDNPFDPLSGYPPSNPTTGFTPKDEGIAGIIYGTPADGGTTLQLYCIDIRTDTWNGIGYVLGSPNFSQPRVGYVARLVNSYYPTVPTQPALPSENEQAAATQAAIWFFSDRYVLNTLDPLHDDVAAIVADVIAAGPLPGPQPPSLTISPSSLNAPVGTPAGPFVVNASVAETTVSAVGNIWSDATATSRIPNASTVAPGTNIWLTAAPGLTYAMLLASASATVPTGNVYLYDGHWPGVTNAQRLILASDATLRTTVTATVTFEPPGSLVVNKTIGGPLAGQQGQIIITVTCNGTILQPPFTIPAGTPAGTVSSQPYTNIPARSTCTVTETQDGHTADVTVAKAQGGQVITIPPGGSATADLTDTYDTGSLVVNKTVTGTAAGQQGAVSIGVVCNESALEPFEIPAGTTAGTVSKTYDGILAGSVCTVTETASGASGTVVVTSEGSPQNVTIAPNGSGTANLIDTYELDPGALVVTKTLAGSAAGQQGPIAIGISCGGPPNVFAFLIAPGAPAGANSRAIAGIPAGTNCLVAEVLDGSTDTITAVATNGNQTVTVPAGAVVTAALTNTFEPLEVADEELPPTGGGSDARGLVIAAGLAFGAGATLVVTARRRTASR